MTEHTAFYTRHAGKDAEQRLNKCLCCGSELGSEPLMRFENMPASAQDMPSAEELSSERGIALDLYRCEICGLVQFSCAPVFYYRDVIRAVGLSETMKNLRRADYRHMIETYGLAEKKWIECGCGRGDFLAVLREFPVKIYGTEANAESAAFAEKMLNESDAVGDGFGQKAEQAQAEERTQADARLHNIGRCEIFHMFPETADTVFPGAPFDCFLSFNFLEHQPDPVSMLGALYRNLADGGYGLITVPSFEYIAGEGNYYELIRDHIANYTLESLAFLCRRCGFEILEEGFIGIGDTLRMVVRKPKKNCGDSEPGAAAQETKKKLPESSEGQDETRNQAERPQAVRTENSCPSSGTLSRNAEEGSAAYDCGLERIAKRYVTKRAEVAAYVEKLKKEGRSLSLWGAGHQGFTIAATTALKDYASYIIDSAPFKQGRYAPASHIPIVAPTYFGSHPTDVIMIAAPGYIPEIERMIRSLYADMERQPAVCDVLTLRER